MISYDIDTYRSHKKINMYSNVIAYRVVFNMSGVLNLYKFTWYLSYSCFMHAITNKSTNTDREYYIINLSGVHPYVY